MPKSTYIKNITTANIRVSRYFDLTDKEYHGGTTLSSGVLPKWDLLNRTYMIKRCTIDDYGNMLTDNYNEELIYKICSKLGIKCAYYKSVYIKYFNKDSNKEVECPAVLTKIFPGELEHYRDIRNLYKFGTKNDQLIDFANEFNVQPALNDLFFIDFLTNQYDRHSKNLGITGQNMSPVFDSGSCLFFDVLDEDLNDKL
jgi:hypothetical protein